MENYNIGTRPIEGERFTCGVGYIIIPSDVDRDKYISICYKTGRVMIKVDQDGGIVTRVPIDREKLGFIDFPEKPGQLGTCVFWLSEPLHKHPVIIGLLSKSDEFVDLREGQFKFTRQYKGNTVEITGSAKDEFLGITLQGDSKADLNINVNNKNKNAKVSVRVGGELETYTTGGTKMSSNESITLKTEDTSSEEGKSSSFTQSTTEHSFQNEKFTINKGEEAMVLGNVLQKFLDKFIDTVAQSTVTTGIGQMPLLNASQIAALKKETESILSKVGF